MPELRLYLDYDSTSNSLETVLIHGLICGLGLTSVSASEPGCHLSCRLSAGAAAATR